MTGFNCPVDGATLVPIERQGIEIDHCPTCRGVWLDRGELDKIIERSAAAAPVAAAFDRRLSYDDRYDPHPPKRKRSLLEDLFD
ncbi:MAG: hypothetical protein E7773_05595 [Sphingomonas sp.]|uniref:TFIIB-type zinc ribbon-containing protein n=1 Tax=Sphingomonas sp. TaxID=28214 RepID=UPI0012006BC7|nr:zf-TFIIB domain-containing protein [Sphingomonas sp.]THD37005.1 MAG: hypothetical protein E7773_05595 [Sphingomonas sp.]